METSTTRGFYSGNVGLGPKPHKKGNTAFFCVHVFHIHTHTHQDFKSHNPNISSFSIHFSSKQQKSHQNSLKPTFKKVKVTENLLYKAKEEKALSEILWLLRTLVQTKRNSWLGGKREIMHQLILFLSIQTHLLNPLHSYHHHATSLNDQFTWGEKVQHMLT